MLNWASWQCKENFAPLYFKSHVYGFYSLCCAKLQVCWVSIPAFGLQGPTAPIGAQLPPAHLGLSASWLSLGPSMGQARVARELMSFSPTALCKGRAGEEEISQLPGSALWDLFPSRIVGWCCHLLPLSIEDQLPSLPGLLLLSPAASLGLPPPCHQTQLLVSGVLLRDAN
jgi:hypothetical protein